MKKTKFYNKFFKGNAATTSFVIGMFGVDQELYTGITYWILVAFLGASLYALTMLLASDYVEEEEKERREIRERRARRARREQKERKVS